MSQQLQTELRTYMSYLDTQVAPITVDDIVPSPTQVAPTPRRTRGGLVVAGSAAVATLLVVGGIAWLAPLDGDSSPADEPAVTTTLSLPAPVSGTVTVTWTNAQWDQGPLFPFVTSIVSTPSGLLGQDRNGLWRSIDGASWEPILTELSGIITIVSSGSQALVAGLRDGNAVLLRSIDGIDWKEVDRSGLPPDRGRHVLATTPSGLTWFKGGGGADVLAVVSGERITEVHNPPWDPCCGITDLVEVGGNIAAHTDRSNGRLSQAWEYVGSGEWSDAMDVPFRSDHLAVVGDTVLMFDQFRATCCDSTPPQGPSQWPVLASNDGINWTEIDTISAQDVFSLHVNAGRSFWIYGAGGGGGNDIELASPNTTLWISQDGQSWNPIDVSFTAERGIGFVHVAGDTIFLFNETVFEGTGEYWIGTIDDE